MQSFARVHRMAGMGALRTFAPAGRQMFARDGSLTFACEAEGERL
jgi:hypothetical protein